jgi:hypothetical protein
MNIPGEAFFSVFVLFFASNRDGEQEGEKAALSWGSLLVLMSKQTTTTSCRAIP